MLNPWVDFFPFLSVNSLVWKASEDRTTLSWRVEYPKTQPAEVAHVFVVRTWNGRNEESSRGKIPAVVVVDTHSMQLININMCTNITIITIILIG